MRAKDFLRQVQVPKHDFVVTREAGLALVSPQHDEAREWLERTAPEDAQFWGDSLVVELRYLRGVIQAIEDDGWRTNAGS